MSYFETGQSRDGPSLRLLLAPILICASGSLVGSLVVVYVAAVLIGFSTDEFFSAAVGWMGFAVGLLIRALFGSVAVWMATRRFQARHGEVRWGLTFVAASIGAFVGYVIFELVQVAVTVLLYGALPGTTFGTFANVVGWVVPALIGAAVCVVVLRVRERGGGRTSQAWQDRNGPYRGSW